MGRVGLRVVFAGDIRLGLVQLQDREKLRGTQQECAEDKCAEPYGQCVPELELICFVTEQIGKRYDRVADGNSAEKAADKRHKGEHFEQ